MLIIQGGLCPRVKMRGVLGHYVNLTNKTRQPLVAWERVRPRSKSCAHPFVIVCYVPACSVTGAFCTRSCCFQVAIKEPPRPRPITTSTQPRQKKKKHLHTLEANNATTTRIKKWTLASAPRVSVSVRDSIAVVLLKPSPCSGQFYTNLPAVFYV